MIRSLLILLVIIGFTSACNTPASVDSASAPSSAITPTPTPASSPTPTPTATPTPSPTATPSIEPTTAMASVFDWTIFHILQGNEYPQESFNWSLNLNSETRYALFDSTTIYQTANPSKQGDINKLFGFSDCNLYDHMSSSARWGWRYNLNTGLIELFAFAEYYGNHLYQHNQTPDATIAVNQPIKLSIVVRSSSPPSYASSLFYFGAASADVVGAHIPSPGANAVFDTVSSSPFTGSYDFYVNGVKKITLPRACNDAMATGYELIPYFGGTSLAPHEIDLKLADEAHAH